jgi:Uma2 family endonuclease
VNVANWTLEDYERAAREYCARLPLEHFMESMAQSTQRKIAWNSLDLVAARRRSFQVFNELLVQYPINGDLGQVVPDNMVIRSRKKIKSGGSFNLPFESAHPFWVLEYVSPRNERKDYEDSFRKYEQHLRVPYYLLFHPEKQELRLYRHNGVSYDLVAANEHGRFAVPELEVEVGLLDGWARFWYQGELIPLPEDLQKEIDQLREQLEAARTQAVKERRRAERQKRRAQQEKHRAQQEKHRADAAEEEVKRLRALLEQGQGKPPGPRRNGK